MNQIGPSIESVRHIAFITPGFAVDESDTTCITALQLLTEELTRKGLKITVFALHYPFVDKTYRWKGVTVHPLNGRNRRIDRRLSLSGRLRRSFLEVHNQESFDGIHAFWLNESALFAQRLATEASLPMWVTAMGQDSLKTNKYLRKLNFSGFQRVIAPSRFQSEVLFKSIGIHSEVIPFGVHKGTEVFPKVYDVVGVGNLIDLKNFDYFLEVCKWLLPLKSDFSAVIVGEGPKRNHLIRLITDFGLDEHIHLLGTKTYEETLQIIGSSCVLLHPSRHEAFGMVLIEALANGTHVLSSPVGIAAESLDMHHLTFCAEQDALVLATLLGRPTGALHYCSVSDSADRYSELYRQSPFV